MTSNTCTNCGFVIESPGGDRRCPICGTVLPDPEELFLLSSAIEILEESRFEEAQTAFEDLLLKYPDNAQAYWGRLRARYHIAYVTDRFGKSVPTCPTRSGADILKDVDYISAIQYANDREKSFMREQAEQIKIVCAPTAPTKNLTNRFTFGHLDQNDAFAAEEEKSKKRSELMRKIKRKITKVLIFSVTFILITATILFWFGIIPVYSRSGLALHSNGNGTLRVSKIREPWKETIRIPSKYLGMPVTSIEDKAFLYWNSIENIYIPDSVTSIGSYAFADCGSLTSISIPDSVTTIGLSAFAGCRSLTSISIPDSVTAIGAYAFAGCSSLESIQYSGTTAQWKKIYFDSSLNSNTNDFTVYCTDGTVTKYGVVTPS